MAYHWLPLTEDFDKSIPIKKWRYDVNNTVTGNYDCAFSELPNIDIKTCWNNSQPENGYAFDNRFNVGQDYYSNRYYGFTDEKWTAQTHTTLVSGTTYEFEFPIDVYWAGTRESTWNSELENIIQVYVEKAEPDIPIPQDIFRSGNQVQKLYRSGDEVIKMYREGKLIFHRQQPEIDPHYEQKYMTFDIISAGTIVWKSSHSSVTRTIEYRLNNGSWTSITATTAGTSFNVAAGDIVEFRGNNATYATQADRAARFTSSTARFNLYGNFLSLVYGDYFANQTTIPSGTYNFWAMFYSTRVVDASNLVMPTGLTNYCFYYFFKSCTSLVSAPLLAADYPASSAYYFMFEGCSNLSTIKCLATNLGNGPCSGWVTGVAASGTFYKDPSMTSWPTGTNGIPSGWTVLDYTE